MNNKTPQELESARERLTKLIANAPICCMLFDKDLSPVDCNERALNMFGATDKDEFLRDYLIKCVPERQSDGTNGREDVQKRLKSALEGSVQTFQTERIRNGGEVFPVYITFSPIDWDVEKHIMSYFIDLNEQMTYKNRIEEAEQFTNEIMKNAPMGYILFDDERNPIDCNERVLKLFGAQNKHLLKGYLYSWHMYEFQSNGERSADKVRRLLDKAFAEGEVNDSLEHVSTDGTLIYVNIFARKIKYKDNFFVVTYIYDVTSLNKLETALKNSENSVRAILDASPLGFIIFNKELLPFECNDYIWQKKGAPSKEYYLEHFVDFSPLLQPNGQVSADLIKQSVRKALNGEHISLDWLHVSYFGEPLPSEITLDGVSYMGQKCVFGYYYDVSKIKAMEKSLIKQEKLLKSQLEQQIVMSEISKGFVGAGNVHELINRALEKTGRYLSADRVVIIAIDYNNGDNYLANYWYAEKAPKLPIVRFDLMDLIVNNFPSNLPKDAVSPTFSCNDIRRCTRERFEELEQIGVNAFIWTALYVEDKLWGILSFEQCGRTRGWTEDDELFSAMISGIITGAVIRDIYAEREKNRLAQQELVADIAKSLLLPLPIETLVNLSLAKIGNFLNLSNIVIARTEPSENLLQICYTWNIFANLHVFTGDEFKKLIYSLFPEKLSPEVEEPVLTCNDITAPGYESYKPLMEHGVKSFIWSSFYIGGKLCGTISFEQADRKRAWTKDENRLAAVLSQLLSGAIMRDMADRAERSRLAQQTLISEITKTFLLPYSLEHLICAVLKQLGEYMCASRLVVVMIDPVEEINHPLYFWADPSVSQERPKNLNLKRQLLESFPLQVHESGQSPVLICSDVDAPENEQFSLIKEIGVKSSIWASLYIRGSLWGVLSIEQMDRVRYWSEDDARLAGIATSLLSGAIIRDMADTERQKALDAAISASRAKSEFLSNMSHEIRTPMNAITGMTHIGKAADSLDRKDYAFSKIEDASAHLLGLINDILDMSKIEANKLELSEVKYSFDKVLQRVVNVINFKVEEKNQTLRVLTDNKIPVMLIGDDQRFAQIITNLLSNAVKFTPDGGTIELRTKLLDISEDTCEIRVNVKDNGIGLSEEQQKKLFSAFQQADSSVSRKYGGTGLGLAISKSLIEAKGGRIWVESELGKGSNFIFTFSTHYAKDTLSSMLRDDVNWSNVRVLAVDDSSVTRDYFISVFNSFDVKCEVAATGKEAVQMITESGGYDIYFIDYHMPEMNGIELTRTIRSSKSDKHPVVIMISATDLSVLRQDSMGADIDKYLVKPLFASTIVDCVNECLGITGTLSTRDNHLGGELEDGELKGFHLLLAEDIEINREILLTLLEDSEIEIDCAENGLKAVEKFCENPLKYDIIFMDVQMPEMDGLTATRQIRASGLPRCADVPIIAMTANVFTEDIENCVAAGMNSHLGKPLDINDVTNKIRLYIRHKKP